MAIVGHMGTPGLANHLHSLGWIKKSAQPASQRKFLKAATARVAFQMCSGLTAAQSGSISAHIPLQGEAPSEPQGSPRQALFLEFRFQAASSGNVLAHPTHRFLGHFLQSGHFHGIDRMVLQVSATYPSIPLDGGLGNSTALPSSLKQFPIQIKILFGDS